MLVEFDWNDAVLGAVPPIAGGLARYVENPVPLTVLDAERVVAATVDGVVAPSVPFRAAVVKVRPAIDVVVLLPTIEVDPMTIGNPLDPPLPQGLPVVVSNPPVEACTQSPDVSAESVTLAAKASPPASTVKPEALPTASVPVVESGTEKAASVGVEPLPDTVNHVPPPVIASLILLNWRAPVDETTCEFQYFKPEPLLVFS